MPLPVDQILYTSFPQVGFKSLASQEIPLEIEQTFRERVVHEYWDAYNPPEADYRAIYLYQLSPTQTLFGWLYNDGIDDIGRSHTPYFLSYYLTEVLEREKLQKILTCLETGPLRAIDRQNWPISLEKLLIPDICHYQPARPGVNIPMPIQAQTQQYLQQNQLLKLFIPLEVAEREVVLSQSSNGVVERPVQLSLPILASSQDSSPPMNGEKLAETLEKLRAKPISIEGVALVSSEGQLMATPLGMDENSVLNLTSTMFYLAQSMQDEFNWQETDHICVRSREGHLILACCLPKFFLLVKAGKSLTGLLEGEINRVVKKLQIQLQ